MSADAARLAERIASAAETFHALVAGCDDTRWQMTVADEGWPVGFVVRHVGWGLRAHRRLVTLAARGEPLPDLTRGDIDDANRKSLTEQPHPERARTLHFLQRETDETVSAVRALSDEALTRTTYLSFFRAEPVTIETLITDLLIWHIQSHTPGVRAALA